MAYSQIDGNSPGAAYSEGLPIRAGRPALKKISPYWYPYRTNAKARWFDREILEVISTEFRDRSVEYYRYALQSGVTTINGKTALPGTIIRNGDTLENIVHRHEPPVTSTPVVILHHDKEQGFIVINKPGSIPVHAAGRYFKNSLVEILKDDFGFKNVHTVNRLDRLTSGLMIIALSPDCARTLTSEFTSGTIRKEYVARVRGEFPAHEITCEEPLLTVDRQMGLNIVHPDGKEAKTVFSRMHYDKNTNTSVVHCRPFTGRSHQIRVHLQYLGHPIANDSVYADSKIWGPRLGIGGINLAPSGEREAPQPPASFSESTAEGRGRNHVGQEEIANEFKETLPAQDELSDDSSLSTELRQERVIKKSLDTVPRSAQRKKKKKARENNPAFRTKEESTAFRKALVGEASPLLPRETGHDIGLGSPVPLSLEAVGIITRMRNQKDDDEDWSRWRDVVFRAKGSLVPRDFAEGYAEQRSVPKRKAKRGKAVRPQNGNPAEQRDVVILTEGTGPDAAFAVGVGDDGQPIKSSGRHDELIPRTSEHDENSLLPIAAQDVIIVHHSGEPAVQRVDCETHATLSDSLRTARIHDDEPQTATKITNPPTSSLDPDLGGPSQTPITITDVLSHVQEARIAEEPGNVTGPDEASAGVPLPVAEPETDREALYCPECYLPLHPDPKPEKLYIFLHALRYTSTSLGAFETPLPEWAVEGYTWE